MYITHKRIKGHVYYYAKIGQRINGQPRTVWQKYLGRAEDIVRRKEQADALPFEAVVVEFGAVAALWLIAQRLQVIDTIDAHVPKRRPGGSVGQYMVIAALNRAVEPTSKARIGEWFDGTVLRRLLPGLRSSQLSSQHFWNHMDRIEEAHIRQIERELAERLTREFGLDLRTVVYDTSNFVTYLNSANPSTLAKRGKSKERRDDLRIVGLALLVTLDHHVPLFHDVYPGNLHDSPEFASITDELVLRYRVLSEECEHVTLILDKSNNAWANQAAIDESPYHFIGSLVPSQHPDLLAIPKERFRELHGDLAGHRAYRTKKRVLGGERTIVVVYNEALYLGQVQGQATKRKKAAQALRTLSKRLADWRQGRSHKGQRPTLENTTKRVEEILAGEHLKEIIRWELAEADGLPALQFHVDEEAFYRLAHQRFGKTILFTDNHDWTDEQIILGYRGQFAVEHAIAHMKDPHFVAWHPMFHWTDTKIRVHAFYCVLALTLTSLLRRQVLLGIERGQVELTDTSLAAIVKTLRGIKETVHLYPPETRIKPKPALTRMSNAQRQLYELLDLKSVAPRWVQQEEEPKMPSQQP